MKKERNGAERDLSLSLSFLFLQLICVPLYYVSSTFSLSILSLFTLSLSLSLTHKRTNSVILSLNVSLYLATPSPLHTVNSLSLPFFLSLWDLHSYTSTTLYHSLSHSLGCFHLLSPEIPSWPSSRHTTPSANKFFFIKARKKMEKELLSSERFFKGKKTWEKGEFVHQRMAKFYS